MEQTKHPCIVGCYVRVSTENQIENYSIEEQIDRLKAYCLAKDWRIHKIYTDAGYSGGNTNRPALNQMLEDIHNQAIQKVVVYKLDRLSRSQKDTLMLIEDEFLSRNVDFVSMMENFDTSTPFGKAMIGILSIFAQLEKDQITERFTMGRIGRSKAGYFHGGGNAPTGYDYVDGNLVVNEYKAMQVREVFDRFLCGYSVNSIQEYMHEKYGGWTSHTIVLQVLRNSLYIGKVKFKKTEYDGLHQPIIDKESFYRVQQLLKLPDRYMNVAQKTPFRAGFLLSSIVFCGKCGAKYHANHGYYKCYSRAKSDKKYIIDPNCKNKNWKIEELDAVVINELKKLIYNDQLIDDIFQKSAQPNQIDTGRIKKQIAEIDAQISRMIDLYQVGNIPVQQISDRIAALQKEKDNLNLLLPTQPDLKNKKQAFIENLRKFNELFNDEKIKTIEEKRQFISNIIKRISVNDNQIEIEWRI